MPCPFGETGSGKIGLRPPTPQELSATARQAKPNIVNSARARPDTSVKYIGGRFLSRSCGIRRPDKIQTDCGRSPKASLRRRVQPQPVGRVPALRPADGPLRRPLPHLRLQALV